MKLVDVEGLGLDDYYKDSSVLSRPEPNGVMTFVTTMQAIYDKILSLDCMDYKVEITTADAQDSYKDGVTVLVTGWLIRKDNLRRKFTQSFFLAPQDKESIQVLDYQVREPAASSIEEDLANGTCGFLKLAELDH